ncbi:MAG: carbohydrate-binding protein [Bacteroidia bacterium]|jgi:Carbohydrate binding module (family 6)
MNKILIFLFLLTAGSTKLIAQTYLGHAWHDSIQTIPGKIQAELYDEGGQGIAYNDSDVVNNGSGNHNPNDGTYYNTFRMNEGVDIDYTQAKNNDINPFSLVEQKLNQLYVGWTKPGEWMNYTIEVKKTGTYQLSLMYVATADGKISISLDGKDLTGKLLVRSTYSFGDKAPKSQWHHWNKMENLATMTLPEGKHLLTLHTVENATMNYDYLEFNLIY